VCPELIEMMSTPACATHHVIDCSTESATLVPELLSALAAYTVAAGATPRYFAALGPPVPDPAAVAATWVPCP
jgi:hypothetical protein